MHNDPQKIYASLRTKALVRFPDVLDGIRVKNTPIVYAISGFSPVLVLMILIFAPPDFLTQTPSSITKKDGTVIQTPSSIRENDGKVFLIEVFKTVHVRRINGSLSDGGRIHIDFDCDCCYEVAEGWIKNRCIQLEPEATLLAIIGMGFKLTGDIIGELSHVSSHYSYELPHEFSMSPGVFDLSSITGRLLSFTNESTILQLEPNTEVTVNTGQQKLVKSYTVFHEMKNGDRYQLAVTVFVINYGRLLLDGYSTPGAIPGAF